MKLLPQILLLCVSGIVSQSAESNTDPPVSADPPIIANPPFRMRLNEEYKDVVKTRSENRQKDMQSPIVASELASTEFIKDNANIYNKVWEGIPITNKYAENLKKRMNKYSDGYSLAQLVYKFDYVEPWEFYVDVNGNGVTDNDDEYLIDICTFPLYFVIPAQNYSEPSMSALINIIKTYYKQRIGVPCNIMSNFCFLNRETMFDPVHEDGLTVEELTTSSTTSTTPKSETISDLSSSIQNSQNVPNTVDSKEKCFCKEKEIFEFLNLTAKIIIAVCSLICTIIVGCQLGIKCQLEAERQATFEHLQQRVDEMNERTRFIPLAHQE